MPANKVCVYFHEDKASLVNCNKALILRYLSIVIIWGIWSRGMISLSHVEIFRFARQVFREGPGFNSLNVQFFEY